MKSIAFAATFIFGLSVKATGSRYAKFFVKPAELCAGVLAPRTFGRSSTECSEVSRSLDSVARLADGNDGSGAFENPRGLRGIRLIEMTGDAEIAEFRRALESEVLKFHLQAKHEVRGGSRYYYLDPWLNRGWIGAALGWGVVLATEGWVLCNPGFPAGTQFGLIVTAGLVGSTGFYELPFRVNDNFRFRYAKLDRWLARPPDSRNEVSHWAATFQMPRPLIRDLLSGTVPSPPAIVTENLRRGVPGPFRRFLRENRNPARYPIDTLALDLWLIEGQPRRLLVLARAPYSTTQAKGPSPCSPKKP